MKYKIPSVDVKLHMKQPSRGVMPVVQVTGGPPLPLKLNKYV